MFNRPSKAVVTRVVGIVGALVALSAFLVLSNIPGSVFAQETGVIMYAENGTAPVRTFTSEDPEGMGIHWDVTGVDADDFMVSGGVLTFMDPPDYENPTDRGFDAENTGDFTGDDDFAPVDNMYQVTVRASEMRASGYMGRALSTETHVTVMVTDKNEPGVATINWRQPEVGTAITASLDDPDGKTGTTTTPTAERWTWYVSTVTNPVIDAENHWAEANGHGGATATYFPRGDCVGVTEDRGSDHQTNVAGCPGPSGTSVTDPDAPVDENKMLRAVATYEDRFGTSRTARVVSEFPVRAEVSSDLDKLENPANGSPGFPAAGDYTRTVSESLGKGMNVGDRVSATDPNNDTLTYELDDDILRTTPLIDGDDDDVGYFSINKATGQLMVKKTLDWDMNGDPPDGMYKFYVRAIDPSGETAEVEVTVIATDANDTPVIMGSQTEAQKGANEEIPAPPSEVRVKEQDSDDRSVPAGPDATYHGTEDGMEGTAGSKMGLPVALALGNENVFTVSDEDERGQQFWDLRGDDADDFTLTQGGTTSGTTQGSLTGPDEPIALVFTNPPDYEMPTDANGDSVYKVILVATDSVGAESTRPITIFVDNVPEQGMATLSVEQPYIDTEIEAMVEDPDEGEAVVTWQWSKNHADPTDDTLFEVINGATASTYTPVSADDGAYLRVKATYIDTTSGVDDQSTGTRDERVQKADPNSPMNTVAKDATTGDGLQDSVGNAVTDDEVFRVMATSTFAVRRDPEPITPDDPPAFEKPSYERMVAENAEVGSIVGAPIMAMGADSFIYDLNATETNDHNYFTIDNYGQIRVGEVEYPSLLPAGMIGPDANADPPETAPTMEDPELDFEGTNTFVLVVRATDMEDAERTPAQARVTVRLKDLNERPYFDKESRLVVEATKTYAETRTNMIVPLAAMEPDGDSLRWEVTGVDAADFEIRDAQDIAGDGKDRVELYFKSQPNYEKPTDRARIAVDLNKDGDTTDDGEAATTDGDWIYEVTVRATETSAVGGGPNMAAELPVTVEVINADEDGLVELNWLHPEVGTAITATVVDLDGDATDQTWTWYRAKNSNPNRKPSTDDTNAAFINEWEMITDLAALSGTDRNPLPSGVTDPGENTETYTPQGDDTSVDNAQVGNEGDVAADEGWYLLARVEYTDPEAIDKAAVGISAYPVRADVSDDDNNSPDFNQDTTTRTVPEDRGVGMTVGLPVDVDVNEDGDTLTYQLDNDRDTTTALEGDVEYFSIDKATGQIKVATKLDWDNNPQHPADADGEYVFWVRATDPSGEGNDEDHDYIEVTVTATNVNDAPKVVDGLAEISIKEVNSTAKDDDVNKFVGLGYQLNSIGDAREADNDEPNLYRRADEDRVDRGIWPEPVAGPDGWLFEYSVPAGFEGGIGRRLHFKKANLPDYEMPLDANGDNVYEVSVVVQDNDGASGMKNVRITVMNVDEMGKLVLTPEQPHSGMPVMAKLTDPDGVEYITDWKWAESISRIDDFPTTDVDMDGVIDALVRGATTDEHKGTVGSFVWAMVDYRDGYSMEDDPVTALDERNNAPGTPAAEQHKYQDLNTENPPVLDPNDGLFHNSDQMESKGTENAVQPDPSTVEPEPMPSTEPMLKDRMVYENVPSTGYVGIPLDMLGTRDTIGGPDGASFVFAENMDNTLALGFYDSVMVGSEDSDDKEGQLAAAVVTHFDAEGDKREYIVEVTDPDAEVAMGPVRVTITVMNVNEAPTAPEIKRGPDVNVAPEFASVTTSRTVAEDTAAGEDIGNPVAANDANGDALTYALGGTDAASFDIDTGSGQLMTKAALDYETKVTYSVTVTASDSGGLTGSIDVTITVTDVDEGFGVSGPAAADYAENGIAAVATYTATNPESATITWTLEGDDAAVFEISPAGVLTFKSSPDYEAAADADTDNAYEVTVVASAGTNGDRLDVTITVTDVVDETQPADFDPLAEYDADKSGVLEKDEVIRAITDYLFGEGADAISKDDVIETITLYLFG